MDSVTNTEYISTLGYDLYPCVKVSCCSLIYTQVIPLIVQFIFYFKTPMKTNTPHVLSPLGCMGPKVLTCSECVAASIIS